jgi:hypothetical protein
MHHADNPIDTNEPPRNASIIVFGDVDLQQWNGSAWSFE